MIRRLGENGFRSNSYKSGVWEGGLNGSDVRIHVDIPHRPKIRKSSSPIRKIGLLSCGVRTDQYRRRRRWTNSPSRAIASGIAMP